MSRQAWVRLLVLVGVLALGTFAETQSFANSLVRGADLVVGLVYVVVGLWLPPSRRTVGLLCAAVGLVWFAGTLWPLAAVWHRAVLVQLLIMMGWQKRPPLASLAIAWAGYALVAIGALWSNDALAPWAAIAWTGVALAAVLPAPSGRQRSAALGCLVALALSVAGGAAIRAASWEHGGLVALIVYDAILLALAVVVWQASRGPGLGSLVDAVVELGDRGFEMRDRLAVLLDDPHLAIGYFDEASGSFLDADGRPLETRLRPDRAVRQIHVDGVPTTLLVHRAAGRDSGLLDQAIVTAARIHAENARLARESAAHLAEVSASRRRVAQAAADERLRFGQQLHSLVTARLTGLAPNLPTRRSRDLLERATSELERLAAGLTPTVLEGGLAGALRLLACDCVLAVDLDIEGLHSDGVPLDDEVAQCAYFVCAEGLANAVRHGGAGSIGLHAGIDGSVVEITMTNPLPTDASDAAATVGSGLTGLRDRVESLGGTFCAGPERDVFSLVARLPTAP